MDDARAEQINKIVRAWLDKLNRRQRFMRWLQLRGERWGDWVFNRIATHPYWGSKAGDWLYGPDLPPAWLCKLLRAHCVVDDQCLLPAHRYCCFCNTLTPNQEVL